MASSEGMDIVRTPARTVVIIGVDPCVDIRAIAGAVASQRGELLVLATGWPLRAVQQRVMHDATDAAADLRLPFEARLVYSEAEVEDHLLPDDTVVMPGPGREPRPAARCQASRRPAASLTTFGIGTRLAMSHVTLGVRRAGA